MILLHGSNRTSHPIDTIVNQKSTATNLDMASTDLVFQLSGTCNSYEWGKSGRDSLAAILCEKTPHDFEIEDGKPYSEMWFGDYPDFPARVLKTGETLQAHLEKNKKALLGDKVINNLDAQLPFLPKVSTLLFLSGHS